jgi:deazaflavin-dependent oxidoreductase (nitroreductase family)
MPDDSANAWEDALLADIREHDGSPTSGPLAGHPLLVLYSTGARSGERRRAILTYSRDDDAYVVAASAGGAPVDPAWLANVEKQPNVTIEIGKRTFEATAELTGQADHDRLWERHVAALPWFGDYPEKAGREIPVVRLRAVEG